MVQEKQTDDIPDDAALGLDAESLIKAVEGIEATIESLETKRDIFRARINTLSRETDREELVTARETDPKPKLRKNKNPTIAEALALDLDIPPECRVYKPGREDMGFQRLQSVTKTAKKESFGVEWGHTESEVCEYLELKGLKGWVEETRARRSVAITDWPTAKILWKAGFRLTSLTRHGFYGRSRPMDYHKLRLKINPTRKEKASQKANEAVKVAT